MDLDGPRIKITRAHYHLQTLDSGCQRFLKTNPFFLSVEEENEPGSHLVSFRIGESVPAPLGVILGDLLHNLRSALEHAVWLVALRKNSPAALWDEKVARQITFPLTTVKSDGDDSAFRNHSLMRFINDDAKTVLKGLQHHEGADDTGLHLLRLHDLWNIDKHRVIHGGFASIDLSHVSFRRKGFFPDRWGTLDLKMLIEPSDTVEDGTPIARLIFGGGPHEPGTTDVDVENQPTAKVLFGSGEVAFTANGIGGLIGHTVQALADIEALPDTPA